MFTISDEVHLGPVENTRLTEMEIRLPAWLLNAWPWANINEDINTFLPVVCGFGGTLQ